MADDLTPKDYPLGAKRARLRYRLLRHVQPPQRDAGKPASHADPARQARRRRDHREFHPLDALVFATGYDAGTGALNRIDVKALRGATLRETWSAGPRCHLGLDGCGVPNLFLITGPGSPSVLSNVLASIEFHVEWIDRCLDYLDGRTIEATAEAESEWVEHVRECVERTIMTKADNWYLGANVPVSLECSSRTQGGLPNYESRCTEVAAKAIRGSQSTRDRTGTGPQTNR